MIRMANADPREGRQYHVRYWHEEHQCWYWLHVNDDLPHAEATQLALRSSGYQTQIFVRDVSPWREL